MDQNKEEALLEHLDRTELLSLIKRMIQIHPDLAELVGTVTPAAPRHAPFDPELYRLKIKNIFATTDRDSWGSEGRAAGPLLEIVAIADKLVQEQNYTDAATLYELVIRETLDNYDTFRWHPYEGDLDGVVEECVNGSGVCLLKEQRNTATRARLIRVLCDVYEFDMGLENDEPVMSRRVPPILIRYTTAAERTKIAAWVRETFALDVNWSDDEFDGGYFEDFLLGLEADTIDDDAFLRISRETENYAYVIERLLKRGRLQEALAEAQQVDNYNILEIADILCQQGQEAAAVQLIEGRSAQSGSDALLQWLQKH